MKENLEAFVASLGCLPLLAITLFLIGAFIGELVQLNLPAPPDWFFIPIILLPLFSTLYLRAFRQQNKAATWLDAWRYGHPKAKSKTIEDIWLDSNIRNGQRPIILYRILNHTGLWQWAVLICFLVLVYVCIGWGIKVAGG